jgi:3-deoxy-D-manno-octulosonic-acid transferase
VVGSLEPDDLEPVRRALQIMLRADPQFAALLVPHDPECLAASAFAEVDAATWRPGDPAPAARVVWVAARGLLADLYALADVAYVGGAMRRPKPHSLLEPAAFAVPAAVGAAAGREVGIRRMIEAGGVVAVRDSAQLVETWGDWLANASRRACAGLAARATLAGGAANVSARRLASLLAMPSA